MSQLQDARLPLPARARRAANDASVSLTSFNGLGAASSAFGNEPQELLGLSAGPPPMSITPSLPRALSKSSGSGQQTYTTDLPSDYNFPQDFDLTDTQSSHQDGEGFPTPGNNNEPVANPLQRLASSEPEQLPWSGIHLNGVLPFQSQKAQVQKLSTNSTNVRIGQKRSIIGSHANETDEGYYTHSQPDLRSVYSGHSSQMHQGRPDQSSIPRAIPSTQGLSGYGQYPNFKDMDHQVAEPIEQQNPGQAQQEPLLCEEAGCPFNCKTLSEYKKHTARHKREHVCNQSRCPRTAKGFATINDLERHQKTVHYMEPLHGQSLMYKCFARKCKQWEKEWPRLDNFKQHLRRMHKTESTEELVQQSNNWYEAEKKPRQPTSVPAHETPSRSSHPLTSSSNQPREASSVRQSSQHYLSPTWQPTGSAARLQQTQTSGRPRYSSFSSQPNPSSRTSPFSGPLLRHFQSRDTSSSGNHQPDPTSFSTIPALLSSELGFGNSCQPPHGRLTSAYTVPNPDTSALSDLSDMNLPSCSGVFTTAQNDLAQIASNFSLEQQFNLPSSDQDLHSPTISTDEARPSSQPSPFSIEAIRAFIDRDTNGRQDQNATFLQIMKAGIEKLAESQHKPATATTTSPSPSVITSTLTSHADSADTRLTYRCPELQCTKTYPRPCDLRKHLKRHHRPYGCTFSKCYERFGSKYDWKRHENSQHFQHECWKCVMCSNNSTAKMRLGPTSSSCAQLFYKRDFYTTHLQTVHSASSGTIRDHLRMQRIGRNCQSSFWCGFCEKIIVLQKKGLEGADERFNHIDEHFKKKRDPWSWVDMDGNMVKGQQQGVDRDKEEEEDVADVLGGDGISGLGVRREENIDDEDDSYDIDTPGGGTGAQPSTVQKRSLPSDFDLSASASSSKSRPAQRCRIDAARGRSPPAAFVICCQCGDGPWTLKTGGHDEDCVMCSHRCCSGCTYLDHAWGEITSRR